MTKLDDAITEVARARKRLEDPQGRIARKNARQALKLAVSAMLRAMDREYPLIRKERVVRVAMTPLAKQRRAKRYATAFTLVNDRTAADLAGCGVRVSRRGTGGTGLWRAPLWAKKALDANIDAAEIRRAVRSATVRSRIAALVRLKSDSVAA